LQGNLSTWRRADTCGRTDGVMATHDEANSRAYLFMRKRVELIVGMWEQSAEENIWPYREMEFCEDR